MLSDFITSHPNWQYDVIIGIISSAAFTLLVILFTPFYRIVTKIRGIWVRFIKDPNLNVELSVSAYLNSPVTASYFGEKIKPPLSNVISTLNQIGANTFEFAKRMDNYDVKGKIILVPSIGNEEEETDNFGTFTIIVTTQNLRLKKMKEGLLAIQSFVFRDLFISMGSVLSMNVDINNEGIVVNFSKPPQVLQSIKDLNISTITAHENGLRVTFSKDRLRASGKFDPSEFDKIERIVKSDIVAQHI
jgi:hypothetical protein